LEKRREEEEEEEEERKGEKLESGSHLVALCKRVNFFSGNHVSKIW
jgi:hypothetical protein